MANVAVVYSREYANRVFTLEPSGGLKNSSLIIQDRETDSYWSIMTGTVLSGEMKGTEMVELPIGEKMQWKDWQKKHPGTKVLAIEGHEDTKPGYQRYFASDMGFRNTTASDSRMATKAPVFAFHHQGKSYAVAHADFAGGKTYSIGKMQLFLFRPPDSEMFLSTNAFIADKGGFENKDGIWIHIGSGQSFDPASRKFAGAGSVNPESLNGFDTFWYNWSLNNPETAILGLTDANVRK